MSERFSFDLFQEQKKKIEKLQKEKPELFVSEKLFNEDPSLPEIGIDILEPDRPVGYLRLYPQDFIVEETHDDNSISVIEPKENPVEEPDTTPYTLYADLVKVGVSSIEALNRLAKQLDIPAQAIGYAGIKDAQAFTSQRIALPKISYERIKNMKFPSFFLTNFSYGKGSIQPSNLAGNRFTMFIRTEKMVDPSWLKEKLVKLKKDGFLNYYYIQRFGGAKLQSHLLGRFILQQKYEEAIKMFLTRSVPHDILLVKKIRLGALENYGKWPEMKRYFLMMPYTFQNEIHVLEYLEKNNDNFIGALINIMDQTKLWVYAYASWLFNKYISSAIKNDRKLPETIPLLLSDKNEDQELYKIWLAEDGISGLDEALKPFKFIQLRRRLTATKIYPKNISAMSTEEGVICSFALPKGVYATTFLMNMFKLQQGLPLPAWLKTTECDTKKYLNLGTIEPAKEKLKDYIFSALDFKVNLSENTIE